MRGYLRPHFFSRFFQTPNQKDETCSIPLMAEKDNITTITNGSVESGVGLAQVLEQVKPNPWTKRLFKLYFFLLIAFLNSCINGYDGSLMSGINVMDNYKR